MAATADSIAALFPAGFIYEYASRAGRGPPKEITHPLLPGRLFVCCIDCVLRKEFLEHVEALAASLELATRRTHA